MPAWDPPPSFSAAERAVWESKIGLLQKPRRLEDYELLKRYCRWIVIQDTHHGATLIHGAKGQPVISPTFNIFERAEIVLDRLTNLLGWCPAARKQAGQVPEAEKTLSRAELFEAKWASLR